MVTNLSKQFDINQAVIGSQVSKFDCLLDGNLGLCCYYSFLYQNTKLEEYKLLATKLIEEVFDRFNNDEARLFGSSYANGIAGFAYATKITAEILDLDINLDVEFENIDNYLFDEFITETTNDKLDCLHSAFGILHYFIARGNKVSDNVIDIICSKAKINSDGLWFESILESEAKDRGVANLSTSHGLTGMLLILFNSLAYTEHKSKVEELIKKGVSFILTNSTLNKPSHQTGIFYSKVNINNNTFEMYPRLAWCYGDLGVALLLYKCHKYFNDNLYKEIADKAGLNTVHKRSGALSYVEDPFFCHGSAGVAMMYRKLYDYSGLSQYKEAEEFWMNKTLAYFENTDVEHTFYQKGHSIIDGLLGVNLSIMTNLSDSDNSSDGWLNIFFL